MKKRIEKTSLLSGAIIAFVLVMFAVQPTNAMPVADQNAAVSVEMGTLVAYLPVFDGKCGEGTAKTEKKTATKAKSSEGKCGAGKCGEGKCGGGSTKAEKKTETKSTSATKAKTSEGKCGEGKCGEGSTKTEKSTSKKAKTSEGKCGEGKCGVA